MDFNLKKDLVFLDLEATGLNVIRDRIVQIALIKYEPGKPEPRELSMIINPGVPISAEAYAVHGIGPEEVANKPTFCQVANQLFDFIGDADLGGYNSDRFDIPMLMEEFHRCGLDFDVDKRKTVDVQKIFYKMEPRTLKAALKFYCGEELEDAHDALADVRATIDVLKGQLRKYEGVPYEDGDGNVLENPIVNDIQQLGSFTRDSTSLDVTQRLKYNANGEVIFNFGKYVGRPVVKVLADDKQYYNWIMNKEFSIQVKRILQDLMKAYEEENNR